VGKEAQKVADEANTEIKKMYAQARVKLQTSSEAEVVEDRRALEPEPPP